MSTCLLVVLSFTERISSDVPLPLVKFLSSSLSLALTRSFRLSDEPYSTTFLSPWKVAANVGFSLVTEISFQPVGLEYPLSLILAITAAFSESLVLSFIFSFISIVTVVVNLPLTGVSVTFPYSGLVAIHGPSIVSRLKPSSLIIAESCSDAFVFSLYLYFT
ncbi:Uncharacterised protein [Gemella haemolysans]|nr:Uncharacterised protein [Gemella haemolysans]